MGTYRARRKGGKIRNTTAFGETKSIAEWLADPRCVANRRSFGYHLAKGMTEEEALTHPRCVRPRYPGFGELKTPAEWAADPRCVVRYGTLDGRLRRGEPVEEAVTRPARVESSTGVARRKLWTAFGMQLTAAQWARDPRCSVGPYALRQRLGSGMDPEAAITNPPLAAKRIYAAFGESKCMSAWASDPRCAVKHNTLVARLDGGWEFERALSEPAMPQPVNHPRKQARQRRKEPLLPMGDGEKLVAFGEMKTLRQWAADSRCVVSYLLLRIRLRRNWALEDAIAQERVVIRVVAYEAFGETKTLAKWAKDPRFLVPRSTIVYRLNLGLTLEQALTETLRPGRKRPKP
jgi:hypothetical protein